LCRSPVSVAELVDAPTAAEAEAAGDQVEADAVAAAAASGGSAGAKVQALIGRLLANRQAAGAGGAAAGSGGSAAAASPGPIKSVVFSQFLGEAPCGDV
jgi:hypothetical protein